jgi:hypothetical protein
MQHETHATPVSGPALWTGRVMSALPVLFLIFDGVTKLAKAGFVIEATVKLGYPETAIVGIGLVLLIATIIYVIPLTSVLGAVLLTGYLGGAVASHVRADNPLFSHTLFPIYMALLIWGGLYLRDQRLRTLFPLRIPRTKE